MIRKQTLTLKLSTNFRCSEYSTSECIVVLVPLEEVADDWAVESGPHQIRAVAEHFGIYKDLFGAAYFLPVVDLQVNYNYDEEYVTPVFRGNIIPPSEVF